MATLLELAKGINLRGSEIRGDYVTRFESQTGRYDGKGRNYIDCDCSDCNCDCSQGGDCDCTSAECEN